MAQLIFPWTALQQRPVHGELSINDQIATQDLASLRSLSKE